MLNATIVGILTFISRIDTASETKSKIILFQQFSCYEQLKFHAQLSRACFYNLWLRSENLNLEGLIFFTTINCGVLDSVPLSDTVSALNIQIPTFSLIQEITCCGYT